MLYAETLLEGKFIEPLGRIVLAFGENSRGVWGRNKELVSYKIKNIRVVNIGDPFDCASVNIYLEGYRANQYGLIYTDKTFKNSVRILFSKIGINPEDIDYTEQRMQGENFVSMKICHIKNLLTQEIIHPGKIN
jgi:hypothetical protein